MNPVEKKQKFVDKAVQVHGEKYDYSKSKYVNTSTKVSIHCNKCNKKFDQIPYRHLNGAECPICVPKKASNPRKLTLEIFIQRAREVHGAKYDYSESEYVHKDHPITFKCLDCKKSKTTTPALHWRGSGCKCQRVGPRNYK